MQVGHGAFALQLTSGACQWLLWVSCLSTMSYLSVLACGGLPMVSIWFHLIGGLGRPRLLWTTCLEVLLCFGYLPLLDCSLATLRVHLLIHCSFPGCVVVWCYTLLAWVPVSVWERVDVWSMCALKVNDGGWGHWGCVHGNNVVVCSMGVCVLWNNAWTLTIQLWLTIVSSN